MPFALQSLKELDFALEKLALRAARGGPMIVELYVPEVGSMRIGLGLGRTVLSFKPSPAETKAKGKGAAKPMVTAGSLRGDGVTYWTWCDDHRHGYRRERLVDIEAGLAAVRLFFRTGELDSALDWEEFTPGLA